MNIITNLDNGVGLQRDFEMLVPKLQAEGWEVAGVPFLAPWRVQAADVNLFLEVCVPSVFEHAREQWLVPNAEWCLRNWIPNIKSRFSRVLCKTHDAQRIFNLLMSGSPVQCFHIGWESRDLYDASVPREWKFLHVTGKSQNKNTAAILRAWQNFKIPYQLTLVSEHYPEAVGMHNVTRHHRISDEHLVQLMNSHQFHLCPSEYEGWGHYLHEALGVGAVVITTAVPPMNEVGAPAELLVTPYHTRAQHCASMSTIMPEALFTSVQRAIKWSPEQVHRASTAARDGFLNQREYFKGRFAQAFRYGVQEIQVGVST